MQKIIIKVPKGIRYLSDWNGYRLDNFPFHHILNKEITGCGYTEYCLTSSQNVVLLSPRKMLLENKEDQHKGEVYYARNEIDLDAIYEKDISVVPKDSDKKDTSFGRVESEKEKEAKELKQEAIREGIIRFKAKLGSYIDMALMEGRPLKILVTYDSFRHVKDVLMTYGGGVLWNQFQVVVDEFQSILIDSRFKSETELELLYLLQDIQKVCFVSATPMLDKYLEMLDEFKNLPYYSLDWTTEDPERTTKPKIEVRYTTRGINEEINRIITPYLEGKFERRIVQGDDGKPKEIISNEAVIYVNSVKSISRAIINNKLTLDQCNILCAQTNDNNKVIKAAFNTVLPDDKKIKKGKKNWVLGTIPTLGQPHKMFTFCTRTVYLGADFYSTNARTFIFSDSNIDCLAVDVSMDLEQILGRQRLKENPWKNSAYLVIKTTGEKTPQDKFEEKIKEKINVTQKLLQIYHDTTDFESAKILVGKYLKLAQTFHYREDYVGVNQHAGKMLVPVFNNLVLVAERRAFDIQQVDYKDRFTVLNAIKSQGYVVENDKISSYIYDYNVLTRFTEKAKFLYDAKAELTEEEFCRLLCSVQPGEMKDYFDLLGADRIRALSYQESDIKRECDRVLNNAGLDDKLTSVIYSEFEVGKRYLRSNIKDSLDSIYKRIGYKTFPRSTDIKNYFNIKPCLITNPESGKRENGYELLSKNNLT